MSKAVDPEFKNMKGCTELTVFRIEKMKVVRVDKSRHGYFHTGDSYIVYNVGKFNQQHIHFWLGKETSQDEAGVAAYKTVELDDFLGGYPVQHREVQYHESGEFLSIFKPAVKYLEGGVDTGFKKVDLPSQYRVRLLQIKGRRNVRVFEVPKDAASLNKGDVFVLDTFQHIHVWNGSESSRLEKAKGVEVARSIRDAEHAGRAQIHIFDEDSATVDTFYKALGSKQSVIKAATPDTDTFSRSNQSRPTLYKVSDASGKLEVTEVAKAPLKQSLLDENDCFILDYGISGIYAWIGKKATKDERNAAMKTANGFIKEKGYPDHIPVTRLVQMGETSVFKQAFVDWADHGAVGATGLLYPKGKKPKQVSTKEEKFDAAAMHQKAKSEPVKLVDDGSGKVEIWRIEDFEMAPLDRKLYGQFFAGDSYVILYTYLIEGVEYYIVYFWQGHDSSQDEKGASAIHATNLDDKYGGRPVQVRVVMHKEPEHFLRMFKGQMVIHSGGKASGFKNIADKDSYDVDGTRLFHVRGPTPHTTKAVQVPETAASLNSNDCFVLETPKNTYLWYGKGCSGDERELANNLASSVSPREPVKVLEGQEPEEFWSGLGGKGEYASGKLLEQELPERPPRLFQCSNASGRFRVEEIPDFVQDDLEEDDVMILDTYDEVFVWIGKGANAEERKKALDSAKDYVKTDPSGRDLDSTVLYQIKQGFEPPTFTCWFHGWDTNRSKPSEADARAALEKENAGIALVDEELAKYDMKFNLEELKKAVEDLPTGVDPIHRERHLKTEEFPKAFGMSKEDFEKLAMWKQTKLKKSIGF